MRPFGVGRHLGRPGWLLRSDPSTTHSDRLEVNGSIFYCVANMPGAFPYTSTYASPTPRCPTRWNSRVTVGRGRVADDALAEGVNVVEVPSLRRWPNPSRGLQSLRSLLYRHGRRVVSFRTLASNVSRGINVGRFGQSRRHAETPDRDVGCSVVIGIAQLMVSSTLDRQHWLPHASPRRRSGLAIAQRITRAITAYTLLRGFLLSGTNRRLHGRRSRSSSAVGFAGPRCSELRPESTVLFGACAAGLSGLARAAALSLIQ